MLEKVKRLFKKPWFVPHAWDAADKKPSFRLWCAVISFHLAVISLVVLHFKPVQQATWTTIGFFAVCMIFHALNKLSKAKIDLNDAEIDLESEKELDK